MFVQGVPSQFQECVSDDGAKVWLRSRGLISLPEWIENLSALTLLDLTGNQLTRLPGWLGNLTSLTWLLFNGNQLITLPESLGNLTALAGLDLRGNLVAELPESLGNLAALTNLDLHGNRLTALPVSFGNLAALTNLDLSGNRLTALPVSFGNLAALTNLDLHRNRLTTVPDSLGDFTALTELNLSDNQLTVLPGALGNLAALRLLNLGGNQLTRLPGQLADLLTKGLQLTLEGNPLDDPLPELLERGSNALGSYLHSLEGAVEQYEAKMLLVGEGNVGKTSLVAALRGAPFIYERPTTHGIEIWPLKFRHPDSGDMAFEREMTVRAWDFGGQEVYRVTHQFFFSRRALYVVVWNARDGQEHDEVEGWLRRIRLRAGHDVPTIVVATHCAERRLELDYPHLRQAFPEMLAGSFEVDNRTGDGLPRLREAIGEQAAHLPQMGQLISPRWIAARDEILALARAEPQIRYEQFVNICKRHEVAGREIVTLAELMHDLGHIIYYSDDEGLRDIVVLNPEWLTKAISYVLEDEPTRRAGGVLNHARLRDVWQNRDDRPTYLAQYHRYFLRLMEKFDVSYRLEGDELHSLVAQLVPHERPALPWQSWTQPSLGIRTLGLIFRFSEPAPGLIPWLTVRHNRASTGLHWRRGVFLRHPIDVYASEALLELHHQTELTIEVRAPSPDLYLNVLRESVEDLIARRWPGLTYQIFIPCPAKGEDDSRCSGQFPLNNLLKMRQSGRSSIPCWECADDQEISVLLTGFTVPVEPLGFGLKQMYDQLSRIEGGIIRVEGQAAEIGESVRRVLRAVSVEVTDCPRLFTLALERPSMAKRVRIEQQYYRLTLWCEHPGYWHPWPPATYEISQPREWFAKIGPYVTLIFRMLQLVVPLAGSISNALLPPEQLAHAQGYLQLMTTLVADLPSNLDEGMGGLDPAEETKQLTVAEGQALRAVRAVLFEYDQLRTFGGMRRVQGPSGEFLWVCPNHYSEYDPGLPIVP